MNNIVKDKTNKLAIKKFNLDEIYMTPSEW